MTQSLAENSLDQVSSDITFEREAVIDHELQHECVIIIVLKSLWRPYLGS